MKRIGEVVAPNDPTPAQAETLTHVLEIAEGVLAGRLTRQAAKGLCSGYERWTAIRFAGIGTSAKLALLAFVEGLVQDQEIIDSKHGIFERRDLEEARAMRTRDSHGRKVLQFPVDYERGTGRAVYRPIPEHVMAREEASRDTSAVE